MIKQQDKLAFDYQTARAFDADGHLHVTQTNISKAMVCPYYGHEIPGADRLGLNRDRVYHLLRDPAELAKAAASFNGKPLLLGHNPVSAEDHDHARTVGALSNCKWVPPYLKTDLSCWTRMAIDSIEDRSVRELSASYRYDPDMRAGVFEGVRYDGVMRNLRANHVSLVPKGRAGPDVAVCDSAMSNDPIGDVINRELEDFATWSDLERSLAKNGFSVNSIAGIIARTRSSAAMDEDTTSGDDTMSPIEVDTILKFLVGMLPEDKLAELDAQLAGEDRAANIAEDSRMRERRSWLAMDGKARHRARVARTDAATQRDRDAAGTLARFPHMNRLG